MKRKIYEKLVQWKESSPRKNALMIDGARRVGKSYIVTEFAKNNYDSFILIDFNKVSSDVTML
ncbi:MAG: AAA family ATPase, partial [Eubacterium sp.]|nr:AAA family ATPase [Eubacterium sp.]